MALLGTGTGTGNRNRLLRRDTIGQSLDIDIPSPASRSLGPGAWGLSSWLSENHNKKLPEPGSWLSLVHEAEIASLVSVAINSLPRQLPMLQAPAYPLPYISQVVRLSLIAEFLLTISLALSLLVLPDQLFGHDGARDGALRLDVGGLRGGAGWLPPQEEIPFYEETYSHYYGGIPAPHQRQSERPVQLGTM